jgi:hypothetical protein
MSTSYDQNRDVLGALSAKERGVDPARFAQAITPSDSTELPIYGRLIVTNASGSSTENLVIIMASNNVDDTTTVSIPIAPETTIALPIIVRRVMATGTGAQISAVLIS